MNNSIPSINSLTLIRWSATFILLLQLIPQLVVIPAANGNESLSGTAVNTNPVLLESVTYHDGTRIQNVWMSKDELALFPGKDYAFAAAGLSEALAKVGITCESSHLEERIICVRLRDAMTRPGEEELNSLLTRITTIPGIEEASPVYYGSPERRNRMLLTGEIVVHFRPEVTEQKALEYARTNDLMLVEKYSFSPSTYLFRSRPGANSLAIANQCRRHPLIQSAYPNWIKAGRTRTAPSPPSNDNIADAEDIAGNQGCVKGSNIGATEEPDEDLSDHYINGLTIWYRWQAPQTGTVRFATKGSKVLFGNTIVEMDTIMAIYEDDLTLVDVNDDRSGTLSSRITFNATAASFYYIAIDVADITALTGTVFLSWFYTNVNNARNDFSNIETTLPGIQSEPLVWFNDNSDRQNNEPSHSPDEVGSSVWFKWIAPTTGVATFNAFDSGVQTAVFTENSVSRTVSFIIPFLIHVYTGTNFTHPDFTSISGNNGECFGSLTFPAQAGTTYHIAVDSVKLEFNLDIDQDGDTETRMVTNAIGCFSLNWQMDVPDPLSQFQWHLANTGQEFGAIGEDLHLGATNDSYTGAGQVIAVIDNGVELTHPDLAPNIQPNLSRDFVDDDNDPLASTGIVGNGDHGTAVAGIIAARGANQIGVRGIAPAAKLTAYRVQDVNGNFTDVDLANALSRDSAEIEIYNNSFGPPDASAYLSDPPTLVKDALRHGFYQGRGGLGNIIVWAGGNGGNKDNSNLDGFANSRYTIAVAASTNLGKKFSLSEKGANIFINAPSGGGSMRIATTDRQGSNGFELGDYTCEFGGTSAATPMVSGVVALMLEANNLLTSRDVMAILMETAIKNDPDDIDWATNGAGFHVNHGYGFGRVDAAAAVNQAPGWVRLKPEASDNYDRAFSPAKNIPDDNSTGVSDTITINGDNDIAAIEYVEVVFHAPDHSHFHELSIELHHFPQGATVATSSILAEKIDATDQSHHDPDMNTETNDTRTYDHWTFGSVRHYKEKASGDWILTVKDMAAGTVGTWESWSLKLYGTKVANAGPDQSVNESSQVTLDGSNSYEGGGITYSWTQTSGATVTLSNADQKMASFTAPSVVSDAIVLEFKLTVTDGDGDHVDTVKVTVRGITNVSGIPVSGGWNLLPMPVISTQTIGEIFSSAGGQPVPKIGKVWEWNGDQYIQLADDQTLSAQKAYWYYLPENFAGTTFSLTGQKPDPLVTLIANQWHLLATSRTQPKPTNNVTGTIWRWKANRYQAVLANEQLMPVIGYWIFSNTGGIINL